jgi:branched-chain amino acid transport system permease protein
MRRLVPLLILIAIVLVAVALASTAGIVMQRRVIFALVNLVAVVSLYIFMGNSGILNFSTIAFMAIGGMVRSADV